MARDKPLANIIATIAAACGKELDIDEQLRAWGHDIPSAPWDPEVNARSILSGFGG